MIEQVRHYTSYAIRIYYRFNRSHRGSEDRSENTEAMVTRSTSVKD
jgi:hypothetical protein